MATKKIFSNNNWDKEIESSQLYDYILNNSSNIMIFLWDFKETRQFKTMKFSDELGHLALAEKILKPNDNRDPMQIVDQSIRGYYDKKNQIVYIYPYEQNNQIRQPSSSMIRYILSKLRSSQADVVIVKGYYEFVASKTSNLNFASKKEALQYLADITQHNIIIKE